MNNADLLKELHIDRSQREDHGSHAVRWPWIAGMAVVMLLLAGGGWSWLHRPITVQTAIAVLPSIGEESGTVLQATGYVTARRQASVSAQIIGTVSAILFEEGDHVQKGQVLGRLVDTEYLASLHAAQAQTRAAEAQVAQYAAQLTQDERDQTREEQLASRGLVAKQTAEQSAEATAVVRAQWLAQQRTVEAYQAQVAEAQVNYGYTTLQAPFSGVVTTKDAQVGEIISPYSSGGYTRTGIGTVVDMDSLEVDVDVNEAYIGRVQPGMPAEAVLDAYPDWKIAAHVIAVVPAADRGKATIKVRVALEHKDARIVPNMGVRVSFMEHQAHRPAAPHGVLVPATAIVQRAGQGVVFVIDGGKARQRVVNLDAQDFGQLRLLPAGVAPGDNVVVAPPQKLRDGSDIQIQNASP